MKRHCRMLDKRIVTGIALLIGLGIGVYFVYFRKGPPQDIMAANKARKSMPNKFLRRDAKVNQPDNGKDYYYYDDDDEDNPAKISVRIWEEWIVMMNHVSIGELYDKCDGDDRVMVGKVVMLPDTVRGGVMSRTFLNVTFDEDLTGGEMYIECQYNGKDLYENHWDLCTVEEGMDDRIIYCPIKQGKHKFIKDLDIPNYLPKGRYSTKAWMTNQNDKLVGCAYSDFTL